MPASFEVRFWNKVRKATNDECWEWQSTCDRDGYGTFGATPGETRKAHRIAYMLTFGIKLTAEQLICHRCDNPRCVNPSHLFVGTPKDNMRDKANKGRCNQQRERNNAAKLTPEIVAEMRVMKAAGVQQRQIARRFGVSEALVSNVVRGLWWN
jgi:predicted XRE-type DNA-binding protein